MDEPQALLDDQHNPPTPAGKRSSSPTESHYSLDLSALGIESPSSTSTPPQRQHVDRIFSEEIDGPTDFTLNLNKWMKAGSRKPAFGARKPSSRTNQRGAADPDNDTAHHDSETDGLNEDGEASGSVVRHKGDAENHAFGQRAHQPQFGRLEPASPTCKDPATPRTLSGDKRSLQPTIEDYHSELMPSLHNYVNSYLQSGPEEVSPNHKIRGQNETLRSPSDRPSSPILSPEHSPEYRRFAEQQPSTRPSNTKDDPAEKQNKSAPDCTSQNHDAPPTVKNQPLEHNNGSQRQLSEVTTLLRGSYNNSPSNAEDLTDRRLALQSSTALDKSATAMQFHALLANLKADYEADIGRLREQIEADRAQHRRNMSVLQQDLELTRRSRDAAVEMARNSREALEDLAAQHESENALIKLRLLRMGDLEAEVARLKRETCVNERKNETTSQNVSTQDCAYSNNLDTCKKDKDVQTTTIPEHYEHAIILAQRMQAQVDNLQRQLDEQQSKFQSYEAHDDGLLSVPSTVSDTDIPDGLREELEAKQSRLNNALIERDAFKDDLKRTQDQLDSAKSEVENLRSRIDDLNGEISTLKAVNSAMDERVSNALSRREKYWQAKLDGFEKERKNMAKALLEQWGKEDLGARKADESKQLYLYKYGK